MKNIIVFYDQAFPGAPTSFDYEHWKQIGTIVGATELSSALSNLQANVFVSVHGEYFPKTAWDAILAFLKQGKNLVTVGGAPFRIPVVNVDNQWITEQVQTAYHRMLNIHEMLPVQATHYEKVEPHEHFAWLAPLVPHFEQANCWNLVPHVTKKSDLPHQMGSAGPMDAKLTGIMQRKSVDGRAVAAPAVLWENTNGPFKGGRWIFITQQLNLTLSTDSIIAEWKALFDYVSHGVTEFWIKPNYALYEAGETPLLTLQAQQLNAYTEETMWTVEFFLYKQNRQIWSHELALQVNKSLKIEHIKVSQPLESGYYYLVTNCKSALGEQRTLTQGFWGKDEQWLAEGNYITKTRDYFVKDGVTMPIVGMTYMTSDVARKFLFLPNVSVWDADMKAMKEAGINWIRTGVWTAYRNIMQVDGHASEEVLRAIDAFIYTAKRHGLQLTFTFFSFTPETWEGDNPYLDPRSTEAQKRFIRSIVLRHKQTKHVDWDLINEPSMFDPLRIFSNGPRSCRDEYEQAAYVDWLKARHSSIESLQEKWNMTPQQLPSFNAVRIPEPGDINFDVQDMHQGKKGTQILDYTLFSMAMHNKWASELRSSILDVNERFLVTVGQDEGLGARRPSPLFYGDAVDYTTVHSWWLNDDLVWDGIFAKTLTKPNVVQETGIMYVETPDGKAKRTEQELKAILERKYAYAFATASAGAIQWIWNTNYYMDNANESHIGALRADGTQKPEADVSHQFGAFMKEAGCHFTDRQLEDIVVVYPYSNDFSNRPLAVEATTRATRVLSYELKVPFRAISEYGLEELYEAPPKLIIVPSVHNFASDAFERLIEFTKAHDVVVQFSGPIHLDEYWLPTSRFNDVVGEQQIANVCREERIAIDGKFYAVSYGKRKIAEVAKAYSNLDINEQHYKEMNIGKGKLIWSVLPLELNDRNEVLMAWYQAGISKANLTADFTWKSGFECAGIYGRKLQFEQHALYIFVSEFAFTCPIEIEDNTTKASYKFELESERSVLFMTDNSGQILHVYRPDEVTIQPTRV